MGCESRSAAAADEFEELCDLVSAVDGNGDLLSLGEGLAVLDAGGLEESLDDCQFRLCSDDEAYLLCVATMVSALYAYAGEKVPWLAVHVLVPWLLLVAWQLPRWWASARGVGRAVLAAGLLLSSAVSLWGTVALVTFNRHNVGEPMLQVEFAGDVRLVVDVIRRRAAASPGDEVIAEIAREYQWPFHWYLRDVKVDYVDEASGKSGAPFVLAERAPPADFSHYSSQQGHYHTES